MGQRKQKYFMRGLDLRTNALYREEGTASDLRNVLLDHSRNLVKRPDFDTVAIPRGILGETGDFLDKLPFEAVIIDLMPFDDYIVIATTVIYNDGANDIPVNKFYKWDEELNTVEFIPFESETIEVSTLGQICPRVQASIGGKLEYVDQEQILHFVGQYPDTDVQDFTYNKIAEDNNLTPIFVYDGKVITRSGCPTVVTDSQEDIDSLAASNDEYVRLVPFKIDDKGRWIFGNFSTHLADYSEGPNSITTKVTIPLVNLEDTGFGHQAFCRPLANIDLATGTSPASRTVQCEIFNSGGTDRGESVGVGQYLYAVNQNITLTPFTPPQTRATYNNEFYRCTVESVSIGLPDEVILGEFKKYDNDTGLWVDSPVFRCDKDITPCLSNVLMAIYSSDEYAYGYEFRNYTSYGYDGTNHIVSYFHTKKGSSTLTSITYDAEFLFITELFEDMYDQETVKIVPPYVNSLVNYGSALTMTDHENLYFTDLSIGGTIENITPFDVIPVGSSKRGPITGVFANESFLTVYREEESYYISGNIFLGNYRIQSYQSTRIGCTDSRGIAEIAGAGIIPSKRGFYMCRQGAQMMEISDAIEPMFTDNALDLQLDMTDVKSQVDFKREYVHFLVKSGTLGWVVLSYSYYHKEWFILDDIDGAGGFVIINQKIYSSDGTNMKVESDTATQSDAYYVSNFETLGAPSLYKKFLQVLVFCTNQAEEGDLYIQSYRNWNYTDDGITTDEIETAGGEKKMVTRRFDPTRSYSCAIKLFSGSGSAMILDGYEYEFSGDIGSIRNEDD